METTPQPATTQQPAVTHEPILAERPIANHLTLSLEPAALAQTQLPATRENLSLETSTANQQVPTIIDARPVSAALQCRKSRRKGRIASLPKLQRDMVNRMLWNGVPYKNIVAALEEADFTVTERNISNWATGGFLEWRLEQDFALDNRLDQDHLIDHLRREDASELPEVGLQAAATRISQIFLQKTARTEDIEANLGTFSKMVDVLCKLNKEIGVLQKQRDDSRRTLGPAHAAARIKDNDEFNAIENERFFSNPPADSDLEKPAVPPLLPPISTATLLAEGDREAADSRQLQHLDNVAATLRAFSRKKPSVSADPNAPAN